MVALFRRRAHHAARHVRCCPPVAAVLFALVLALSGAGAGPAAAQSGRPSSCADGAAGMTATGDGIAFRGGAGASELVTVAAVGDVLLHDAVQKFAATRPDGFRSLFRPVADLILGADIAFANLEGPAAAGVTKTGRTTAAPDRLWDGWVYSGYPMFNYHPSVLDALKKTGFDVLLTANNHALDRYAVGADRTIDAIRAAGLKHTGTRRRGGDGQPWYAVTEAVRAGRTWRIAWLGCTYGTNGIPDRHGQVLRCYRDRARALGIIEGLARRDDIHAVMFAPHWGAEYEHEPEPRQRALAAAAIEAGATAVIGTHPHVMQPVEKHVAKDGREGLIAYSLGNFVSNQISLARRSAPILLLGLNPDPRQGSGGKLRLAAFGWIPIWVRNETGRIQVEAIDRAGPEAARHFEHLNGHLPPANRLPADADYWRQNACGPAHRQDRLPEEY
ncbi:MAG: CapA family protein [Rhodospirillaceae bacterium]|nr:CapA family protein [Rhodospirillaceae bacterium]MYB11740.1 CapA family protein [Rhodospirillaceae bacterium]MYI47876.1 CapA family protein [Rhodospirillaceae bacterium]